MITSIAFPSMVSGTKTYLVSDHEATAQNLLLMLKSDRTALFGDPYYGTILKKILFEQNSPIIQDLVIDEIYTDIITFMPQIRVSRNDIHLTATKTDIIVTVQAVNLIDYQIDLFNIKLTNDEI